MWYYIWLKEIINKDITTKKRIVVFTERIASLKFLTEQLVKDKIYKQEEIAFLRIAIELFQNPKLVNLFRKEKDSLLLERELKKVSPKLSRKIEKQGEMKERDK